MSGSIRLSQKHGVNPSVMVCFYCGEDVGVALLGRLPNDAEAPRKGVFDKVPCNECKALMAQGVMFIAVRDGEPQSDDPYRTGELAVVKDEAVTRIFDKDAAGSLLQRRVGFIEQSVGRRIGFWK